MFFGSTTKFKHPYVVAAIEGDVDKILSASAAGLQPQDLVEAFNALEGRYPDWRTRKSTDMVNAIIRGLERTINANKIKAEEQKQPDESMSSSSTSASL
jgi:ABC-type branched-subunit amino acid transport system substrate-binding protein